MDNATLIKTMIFDAPRETVWAFLTEKDKLEKWFHPALADFAEGEDYALVGLDEKGVQKKICWGTVLKMIKPDKLVYTFTISPLNGAMTTVTWTLEEIKNGTKLTLRHEGIADAAGEAALGILMGLDSGWDGHVDALKTQVNSSTGSGCAHT
jgi:uncharacterized protein YndB with AHSA1/START domain